MVILNTYSAMRLMSDYLRPPASESPGPFDPAGRRTPFPVIRSLFSERAVVLASRPVLARNPDEPNGPALVSTLPAGVMRAVPCARAET